MNREGQRWGRERPFATEGLGQLIPRSVYLETDDEDDQVVNERSETPIVQCLAGAEEGRVVLPQQHAAEEDGHGVPQSTQDPPRVQTMQLEFNVIYCNFQNRQVLR